MSEKKNCGCGQDPCVTYGAEPELVGGPCEICGEDLFRDYDDSMGDVCLSCYYEERSKQDDEGTEYDGWLVNFAESFGAESLMAINQNTPISNFTTNELTHSSTVQGDFNQASINSSGHQNFEVRGAESRDELIETLIGTRQKLARQEGIEDWENDSEGPLDSLSSAFIQELIWYLDCLLYTSPSPRD